MATLYERVDAGEVEALREVTAPGYRLRVPDLGVDIHGVDAVLAWLQGVSRPTQHRIVHVFEDDTFIVATVTLDGDDRGPCDCHVFTRSRLGLTSCCVVRGTTAKT